MVRYLAVVLLVIFSVTASAQSPVGAPIELHIQKPWRFATF